MASILEARTDIDEQAEQSSGMLGAGRRLLAAMWEHVEIRLELLTLELAEERSRVLNAAIAAGSLVFFGALASTFIGVAILIAAWDTEYRIAVAVALPVVFAVAAFIAFMTLRRLIGRDTPILKHSLAEWRRDVSGLRKSAGDPE